MFTGLLENDVKPARENGTSDNESYEARSRCLLSRMNKEFEVITSRCYVSILSESIMIHYRFLVAQECQRRRKEDERRHADNDIGGDTKLARFSPIKT